MRKGGRMHRSQLLMTGALALTLSSCAQQSTSLEGQMWQHYQRVEEIRDAVVMGNLDMARDDAQRLIDHELAPDLPPGSERVAAQMRGYAMEVADADSMEGAAVATANMVRTCGQCHQTYGRGPEFGVTTASLEDVGDDVPEMARHQWAFDRMWDGLVVPSDSSWIAGARTWFTSSMLPGQLRGRNDLGGELHGLEARLHYLGRQAVEEETPRGRAALYGEMMAACARCHVQIRAR